MNYSGIANVTNTSSTKHENKITTKEKKGRTMKALLVATLITFGMVFTASASGNNMLVKERANHLSDQMIRDLRLNNYQANECREINTEVISKIAAIENEFAGNQEMIDQKTKKVLAERDLKLENILSTVQYNKYFGKRTAFNKADQEFVAKINTQNSNNASTEAMSTASTNDAVTVN